MSKNEYIITVGGPRTHSHPEVDTMACEETLEESIRLVAKQNPNSLEEIHIYQLTDIAVTATSFAIEGLDKHKKDRHGKR